VAATMGAVATVVRSTRSVVALVTRAVATAVMPPVAARATVTTGVVRRAVRTALVRAALVDAAVVVAQPVAGVVAACVNVWRVALRAAFALMLAAILPTTITIRAHLLDRLPIPTTLSADRGTSSATTHLRSALIKHRLKSS